MKSKRFSMYRTLSLVLVAALAALAFSACGGAKSKKDGLVDAAGPNPAFLAAIPADTPYVFASLEAVPIAPIMERLEGMGTALDSFIDVLVKESATSGVQSEDEARFLDVMQLMKGKFSRQGLESVGFSLNPRAAFYGVGFLPVMRMELKDPVAFQNFLDQVIQTTGVEVQTVKRGELSYNTIGDESAELPFTVQGNELIFGFTPASLKEKYLPHLLGETTPESSMADSRALETLKDAYGFTGYGVGYIDLQTIAKVMIAPDPGLNGETWVGLDLAMPTPDAVCQREYLEMVANYPRVVVGYDRIDRDALEFRGGLEAKNGLGSELAKTASFIPAYGSDATKDALMNFGLGIDVQKFLDFARTKASAIRETPYQCQNLQSLNQMADQFASVSLMAPPALTQLKGVHVSVSNMTMPSSEMGMGGIEESDTPQPPDGSLQGDVEVTSQMTVEGYIFISSSAPEALVETLKLMNPALAGISIKADGTPVPLTGLPGLETLIEPYAVMSTEGIAISSGPGASGPAADAVKSLRPSEASPMVAVKYDLSAFASLIPMGNGPEEVQGMMKQLLEQGPVEVRFEPDDKGLFFRLIQTWPSTP